jgi:hypothetical protein
MLFEIIQYIELNGVIKFFTFTINYVFKEVKQQTIGELPAHTFLVDIYSFAISYPSWFVPEIARFCNCKIESPYSFRCSISV